MLTHLAIADQLKALQAFSTLTQAPATFDAIYDLDEVLRKTHLSTISVAYLQAQPEVAAIIAERYLAPVPDLDALLTLPTDSLGYQFAHHLISNHFDPEFYRKRSASDDITYISLRRSQTHDIWHIVTGFGTDPAGELGLQAFQLAQMRSPIAIGILVAGLINILDQPATLNHHVQHLIQGWEMGLTAKPLLAQKWEEAWEKSLTQWQLELGLKPTMLHQTYATTV